MADKRRRLALIKSDEDLNDNVPISQILKVKKFDGPQVSSALAAQVEDDLINIQARIADISLIPSPIEARNLEANQGEGEVVALDSAEVMEYT